MNLKLISVVIGREYLTRVKKKSFLITTFLVPVLFAALCCVPVLIMLFNRDEGKVLAVVDRSGIVMPSLESDKAVQFADCSSCCPDSLKKQFDELPYSALLYISPLDSTRSVTVSTYSKKPVGVGILEKVKDVVETSVRDYRIGQYNIDGLSEIIDDVKAEVEIKTFTIDEDGEDKVTDNNVYMYISLAFGMIIFIFITMFSSSVLSSVVEEKQSKIVEVLLSSVDAVNLMFGKIIGVAMVALTQFLLWIILTAAIVGGVFAYAGVTAGQEMVTDPLMSGTAMAPELGRTVGMIQTLGNMDIPQMLLFFVIFFIFGYLLYASMFAAIGSAVDNVDDSNQLQVPLTVPLMLGYFIAVYSWNAPDSALSVWGSIIPFTSPIVMLARIPFGVPSWQLWLSVAVLILTFALMAWISAKIYRVGILTSGRKAGYKDLWKWLRQE